VAALGLNTCSQIRVACFVNPCVNQGRPRRAAPTVRPEILPDSETPIFLQNFGLAQYAFLYFCSQKRMKIRIDVEGMIFAVCGSCMRPPIRRRLDPPRGPVR